MTLFEVDEAANEIRREVDVDAHIILGSTFDEKMNGKIRVSVVAAGLQAQAAAQPRPTPHVMREQIAGGLSAANLNAPSPAAELGLHRPAPAPQPVPPPPAPPQPVVFSEASRPASPIIRPRPMPLSEPEDDELELNNIFQPAPAPVAPAQKQMITTPPPAPPQPQPQAQPQAETAPAPQGKSFASLFGWKSKPAEGPAVAAAPPPRPVEEDSFDDELEIPAFLRRSGNA
jgi:cell division protein FtsZ